MVNLLEELFPSLAGSNYRVTSPCQRRYNCVAWAAGDTSQWWWPGANMQDEYWPADVVREQTVEAFQQTFAGRGYALCESADLEPGFEKVAVFVDTQGLPQHAARQLPTGLWTSKLGALEDIQHHLHDLEGITYGTVGFVMKRPIA